MSLRERKKYFFISRSTAADESELREEDVWFVTSSDPAGSALLAQAAGGYEACASAR